MKMHHQQKAREDTKIAVLQWIGAQDGDRLAEQKLEELAIH